MYSFSSAARFLYFAYHAIITICTLSAKNAASLRVLKNTPIRNIATDHWYYMLFVNRGVFILGFLAFFTFSAIGTSALITDSAQATCEDGCRFESCPPLPSTMMRTANGLVWITLNLGELKTTPSVRPFFF